MPRDAITIALAAQPVSNATLAAALSHAIGHTVEHTIAHNVQADALAATCIVEQWRDSSAVEQARLIGAANDGALAALPQLHEDNFGAPLLPGKLDEETAAFAQALIATAVAAAAAANGESVPLRPLAVAEAAATLRSSSRAERPIGSAHRAW